MNDKNNSEINNSLEKPDTNVDVVSESGFEQTHSEENNTEISAGVNQEANEVQISTSANATANENEISTNVDPESNQTIQVTMFTRVNQVVTTLISGVFGSLVILLGVIFGARIGLEFGAADGGFSLQTVLVSILMFSLGLTISQVLDGYLTKLVERENFNGISFKIYKNISSQLVLLLLSLPFLFLSLGFEPTVSVIFMANFTIFSHVIFSQIIYFDHRYRQLGSLFGLFLASVILNLMIFYLDLAMTPLLLLLFQPIITTLRELGAQSVDGLSSFEI